MMSGVRPIIGAARSTSVFSPARARRQFSRSSSWCSAAQASTNPQLTAREAAVDHLERVDPNLGAAVRVAGRGSERSASCPRGRVRGQPAATRRSCSGRDSARSSRGRRHARAAVPAPASSPSATRARSGSSVPAGTDATSSPTFSTAVPPVLDGLQAPSTLPPERTGREDRRLKFYGLRDNLMQRPWRQARPSRGKASRILEPIGRRHPALHARVRTSDRRPASAVGAVHRPGERLC